METLMFFIAAFGIACFMEALPCMLFPSKMREAMQELSQMPESFFRTTGIVLLVVGLALVWIAH